MILREIKVAFNAEVPIVDNEISNNLAELALKAGTKNWDYTKGDVVCCGVLYGDTIKVFFREKTDSLEQYKAQLQAFLDTLPTMYAFNYSMEKGNFQGFLGKSYFIEEIKPFKGKGKSKQWFFEEILYEDLVNEKDIPADPIENDSGECISLYEQGESEKIINHNIADLIKQYHIWKNKNALLKKYKANINKDGWFQELVRA